MDLLLPSNNMYWTMRAEVQVEKTRIRIILIGQLHLSVAGRRKNRKKIDTMDVPVKTGRRTR